MEVEDQLCCSEMENKREGKKEEEEEEAEESLVQVHLWEFPLAQIRYNCPNRDPTGRIPYTEARIIQHATVEITQPPL
jgi:hypothetical protein